MNTVIVLFSYIVATFIYVPVHAGIIPAGGENWTAGQASTIRWIAADYPAGDVDIHLWDGEAGKWYFIVSVPVAKELFTWIAPQGLQGKLFRIRVQSKNEPSISFMSESYFTIAANSVPGGGNASDSLSLSVHLFPNPASEFIVASWAGEGSSIQIVDLLGRDIFHQALAGSTTITLPVHDILPGFYIMKVTLVDGTFVYGRLLIESS